MKFVYCTESRKYGTVRKKFFDKTDIILEAVSGAIRIVSADISETEAFDLGHSDNDDHAKS